MWTLELFRENKRRWHYLLLSFVLMFLNLLFEGGLYLLPGLLIFYFAYHKPIIESAGIFIWCLILLIKAIMTAVSAKHDFILR